MAAVDLDLLPQDQGAGLIRHVLNTVEGLEKWRGHLYNWYDTVSARPMAPPVCLHAWTAGTCAAVSIALRRRDWRSGERGAGRAGPGRCPAPWTSAPLYDPDAPAVFHRLGGGAGRVPPPAAYDLMASEARQTSYVTVARGEVPPRHWRAAEPDAAGGQRLQRHGLLDRDHV